MIATILVVEDNSVCREGFTTALRQKGYAVVPACNGREALDYLSAGPLPDLILLDMLMPVLDGWHFLERLGPQPPVPTIVTTATILTREWAQAHGCAGFLRKPIEPVELLDEVERCLGPGPGAR